MMGFTEVSEDKADGCLVLVSKVFIYLFAALTLFTRFAFYN